MEALKQQIGNWCVREILYTIVESDCTHNRTIILLTALSPFFNGDGYVYLRKSQEDLAINYTWNWYLNITQTWKKVETSGLLPRSMLSSALPGNENSEKVKELML